MSNITNTNYLGKIKKKVYVIAQFEDQIKSIFIYLSKGRINCKGSCIERGIY